MERHWREMQTEDVKQLMASHNRGRLRAMTPNQGRYLKAIETSTVTVCTGPAGTGKTYMACGVGAQMLKAKRTERIVVTRPLRECDEEMGILPGDAWEKIADIMAPMFDALEQFFTPAEMKQLKQDGLVQVIPLAKMRGSTFRNSFVILDEAQNATFKQLKMFLTRFGERSRVIVCGDHTQSDLPYGGRNSLLEVIDRFRPDCHASVSIVRLGREDIVRHELIKWIDERLSGSAGNGEVYHPSSNNDRVESFTCPGCQATCYFEDSMRDKLIRCWNCSEAVELLDEQGDYDPVIIEDEPSEGCSHCKPS